jgi:soluble cytochrome b562
MIRVIATIAPGEQTARWMPSEDRMEGTASPASFQRWWAEHSELDALVQGVARTLETRHLAAAGSALDALADALEAHFGVEERVYFPLVERFSPQHAEVVRGARFGHRLVIEALEKLRDLVERGEMDAARHALGAVLERFRLHEAEEARLIAELEMIERSA